MAGNGEMKDKGNPHHPVVRSVVGNAVEVKDAFKSYGSLDVLKGLDMSVPYGSIYGLLGSSGCGKTTLLRCILGRLNLVMGEVRVLGRVPGTWGHDVPGRDVGYMPQEMALYGDFTTYETMSYFGILHGMSRQRVKQRRKFLLELLELHPKSRTVRTLSGGQKRRFSFAIAMLQEPPLLILDEPTVGVDPLLRAKIWHHMMELTSSGLTTIVITTHYIEEAKQAHQVGLMRDGRLLAEAPPSQLIQTYNMKTLEEVFLLLCKKQDVQRANTVAVSVNNTGESLVAYDTDPDEKTPLVASRTASFSKDNKPSDQVTCLDSLKKSARGVVTSLKTSCKCKFNPSGFIPRPRNIVALCWKNVMKIIRNPGLLLFQFLLPTLQIALFCFAIGNNLEGIKTAYLNLDTGLNGSGFPFLDFHLYNICNNTDDDGGLFGVETLGQLYINKLKKDPTFELIEVDGTEKDAVAMVERGDVWAAVIIYEKFTWEQVVRICSIASEQCKGYHKFIPPPNEDTINQSTIHLQADVTNAQITITIQNQTLQAYELFLTQIIESCGNVLHINNSLFTAPINIDLPPVYGKKDLSFIDYMGPGVISSLTFGISIALSAVVLIVERNEGLIDRTWVAGVNVPEIILSQVITQFFILLVQITLLVTVVIFGFKIYNRYLYNIWLIAALAMLQGLTGMSFGLLLSSVFSSETAALQASVAAFYPAILLSGVMWPFEGMPTWLRYISISLPATYPAEAMRAIMGRGWGLAHLEVYRGFLVSFAWCVFFLFNAGLALWIRK